MNYFFEKRLSSKNAIASLILGSAALMSIPAFADDYTIDTKDAHASINFSIKHLGYSVLTCLLYTSPSPRDRQKSRMPSSA